MPKRFTPEKIHITPELCAKITAANLDLQAITDDLLERHQDGDWGDSNANQQTVNEVAIQIRKGVVKSVYTVDDVGEIWLMTSFNAQRHLGVATFVMLAGQHLSL